MGIRAPAPVSALTESEHADFLSGGKMDYLHNDRMREETRVNGRRIRGYEPKFAAEEIEEICQRIAQNNKAAARQKPKSGEQEQPAVVIVDCGQF
jgi:hypothetical protein